jgi:hypothetical protein
MTCDEVEIMLDGRHQSVSSRIRKGVQDGYLMNSGDKRKTRTGRNAILWMVKPKEQVTAPFLSDFNVIPWYEDKVYLNLISNRGEN